MCERGREGERKREKERSPIIYVWVIIYIIVLRYELGHWNFVHILVLFIFWIEPLPHKRESAIMKSN